MMHHMRCPEKPALMAGAVKPVICEVFSKKQNAPRPPLISNVEDSEAMDCTISRKHQCFVDHAKDYASRTHCQTGCSVLELVEITAHHRIKHHFQQQKRDEAWNGQVDEIGYLRHEISSALEAV